MLAQIEFPSKKKSKICLKEVLYYDRNNTEDDGMMCGMCESHVCDNIRNKFTVKKKVSVPLQGHRHHHLPGAAG